MSTHLPQIWVDASWHRFRPIRICRRDQTGGGRSGQGIIRIDTPIINVDNRRGRVKAEKTLDQVKAAAPNSA